MVHRIILLALLLALAPVRAEASDARLDAPPDGIAATMATLSQILKDHESAVGRVPPGGRDTRSEEWAFNKVGLKGTESLARRGSDYHSRIVEGPLTEEYGLLRGQGWHKDFNGVVSPAQSEDYSSFEMLIFMHVLADASDPKYDVKVLGEVNNPRSAYVLEVKATSAEHPEWVFYDKQTGLIDEAIRIVDGERATVTFDDYRDTKGLKQPWHLHYHSGGLDFDFVRTSLSIGEPVDAGQFAMPASLFPFLQTSNEAGMSIPARILYSHVPIPIGNHRFAVAGSPNIVVRLFVGDRGLDFVISAARPDSLIDLDVAHELGLPTYGQLTHAGGEDLAYDTVLDSATLGGMTLRRFALRAKPFHYHLEYETKIVGILGYDFLSTGIFKADFVNRKFDLLPASFASANQPPTMIPIPISFDSGYPFFHGIIDGHETDDMLFDNDFDHTFVFGGFTQRFPDEIQDVYSGERHTTTVVPFADSKRFGRDVQIWLGKIPSIIFGPARFSDMQLITADFPLDAGGHNIDAILGGDLLRYYDIYFDYPHDRIFLSRNADWLKAFHTVRTP